LIERSCNIVQLTGQLPSDAIAGEQVLLEVFKGLDARVVDLDRAEFTSAFDPYTFDARKAAADPELSVAIPAREDWAKLGRRSRYNAVYLVWEQGVLQRIILPIHGAGMWSMIYGYLAVEGDFNTIAGVSFYEQNETPGLGDQITRNYWRAQWQGKQLFDDSGELLFHVAEGPVSPGSAAAAYQVDALTGATVTANAVTALVRYWLGPDGYGPLLKRLRERPPSPQVMAVGQES
jgi:Na+-transporting NADH:ubiquinone oxidoreductase subunit C